MTPEQLKTEFGTYLPRLEDVASRFLGFTEANAKAVYRQFYRGELGFPAFKLSKSNKAPLFVRVEDLADYINQQANQATEK